MQYPVAYMVAGLSSRFKNSNIGHKGLAKIGPNKESLIELSIDRAIKAGFNKIIFIVNKETEPLFKNIFGNNYKGIPIEYSLQEYDQESRDRPWGTNDAICSALSLIENSVLVCTGDDLYSEETYQTLFNHQKTENTNATVGYPLKDHLPEEGEVNRGIFHLEDGYVTSSEEILKVSKDNLAEKNLAPETPINIGIFLLQKQTLEKLNEILTKFKETHKEDRKIECYLNVELGNLIKNNEAKLKYYQGKGSLIGITNPDDEITAREKLAGRNL